MISKSLYASYRFFKAHAGYATPPGLAACAHALARAEMAAREIGIAYVYSADDYEASWSLGADGKYHAVPSYVVRAVMGDGDVHAATLAALGAVDAGADSAFYRVVEAQLAAEALQYVAVQHG